MNKSIFHPLTSLLTTILAGVHQSRPSVRKKLISYSVESSRTYPEFIYLGSINKAKATIVKTQPGVYALLTDMPILIDTKHYQLLNACNLPGILQIAGKPVIISGKLYINTNPSVYLFLSQPFVLDEITDQ